MSDGETRTQGREANEAGTLEAALGLQRVRCRSGSHAWPEDDGEHEWDRLGARRGPDRVGRLIQLQPKAPRMSDPTTGAAGPCPCGDGSEPCDTVGGENRTLRLPNGDELGSGDRIGRLFVARVADCSLCGAVNVYTVDPDCLALDTLSPWPNPRTPE